MILMGMGLHKYLDRDDSNTQYMLSVFMANTLPYNFYSIYAYFKQYCANSMLESVNHLKYTAQLHQQIIYKLYDLSYLIVFQSLKTFIVDTYILHPKLRYLIIEIYS